VQEMPPAYTITVPSSTIEGASSDSSNSSDNNLGVTNESFVSEGSQQGEVTSSSSSENDKHILHI
jgi:hypothetical protein